MFAFRTSGTTGDRLVVPSTPLVAARYLAIHLRALRRFGIEPTAGPGQVGVVLLGHQQRCFTYASVTPLLGESGLAKLNLHPDDWRRPEDRAAYLEALQAEFLTGDPIALSELLQLRCRLSPRAILSTSMTLLPGLRAVLEERFACPVLDIFSMNEAGPIGHFDARLDGHVLLQPGLFVEVLDDSGAALPPGQRGEVTLTGGFNDCLPLLRYRTGDYAALEAGPDAPVLRGLEGRPPVRFRTSAGSWINNVDITHAMATHTLSRFALHQTADGHLILRVPKDCPDPERPRATLQRVFGAGQAISIEWLGDGGGKVVQYTSALRGAASGEQFTEPSLP